MAAPKTVPTGQSVQAFLKSVPDDQRRRDCRTVMRIMKEVTEARPRMWGHSIIGFGRYHYKYASGREGDWFLTGVSPRKQNLTLYVTSGFKRYDALSRKLGKHTTGKSCLYIKKLDDVDLEVLRELIEHSVQHLKRSHG